jgi:large subunit ribosomal protein L6
LVFEPINDSIESNALAGTSRAVVSNMVKGVHDGFECKLVMVGVGYRAKTSGADLELTVGFSHPVIIKMPKGVRFEIPTQTEIVVKGFDKAEVFQLAANIRKVRPPEPYKGKGIRYENEVIIRKEGKKK